MQNGCNRVSKLLDAEMKWNIIAIKVDIGSMRPMKKGLG